MSLQGGGFFFMKVSVIAPVKNEFPWIGYSIKAAAPYVHQFIYAVSKSDDGTEELLKHLAKDHPITVIPFDDFHPLDQKVYNEAFNVCINEASGDACWFLHPDMILTEGRALQDGPLAWTTEITSFAGNLETQIVKGRATRWKNIHAKKFGLHYFGGYGSQNEDFYHSAITGNAYKHYGTEFSSYPFQVETSGIKVDHFCEVKNYSRRLEKMKLCLRTQNPYWSEQKIEVAARNHPRVTLDGKSKEFGQFEFIQTNRKIPEAISKYESEFSQFRKDTTSALV